MIPNHIIEYLEEHGVSFRRRPHARAITASELAQTLHVTGYRVAKSVIVEAAGKRWMAVLPAADMVDMVRLGELLGGPVRMVPEPEFANAFGACEPGAEPPFGALYGLPVLMDTSLLDCERVVFRAGSHRESVDLALKDYQELEKPQLGSFAVLPYWAQSSKLREVRA